MMPGSSSRILEHFALDRYLVFIGGADLAGVRHDKASVIAHTLEELHARDRLDADARLIMIGDREHDVHGARAHGIDTIGVLWGYGSQEELLGAGAVQLAQSPAALGALLA
jgi:phosphoglycolate phosphatase